MSNKMNKGDWLEIIARDLEKSLSDNPTTSIKLKHFVEDRDGIKREIDIFIQVSVNSRTLTYALECKNYNSNSKVKLKDITDFYGKIEHLGAKGIFVTTGSYQQGVIEKAKKLNIDLFKIVDSPDSTIEKVNIYSRRWQIIQIEVYSQALDQFPEIQIRNIYMGTSKKRYKYTDFAVQYMKKILYREISKNTNTLFKEFYKFEKEGFSITANKKIRKVLAGNYIEVYFKVQGKYYPLTNWSCFVDLWVECAEENRPIMKSYVSVLSGETFAKFLSQNIKIANDQIAVVNLVKRESDKKYVLNISGKEVKEENDPWLSIGPKEMQLIDMTKKKES